MTKVLITGATGNVGLEVIKSLQKINHNLQVYAGVRDLFNDKLKLSNYEVNLVHFDFLNTQNYREALSNCDILFLLRPPQISNTEKYFKPLIEACKEENVKHIIFLSVQGVEKSKIIPHHKIEKLILESNIPYTFLRPAYFMQNFTTTLRKDIVQCKTIYLPAGNAKFTLIDVCDIGAVAATIIINISLHKNKAYELTNKEKLTFSEMAKIVGANLGVNIKFKSPNLLSFFITKRKEQIPTMLILVMIMLHYLPRFQKEPETTPWVDTILKRPANTFEEFVKQNKSLLTVF